MSALIKFIGKHWYGMVAPLLLLGIFALVAETEWVRRVENIASDFLLTLKQDTSKEQNKELLLVAIDQDSMDQYQQGWPWRRNVHADLFYLLENYNPSVIAFDIIFSDKRGININQDKTYSKQDNTLVDALQQTEKGRDRVVLAGYAQQQKEEVKMLKDKMDLGRTKPLTEVTGDIFLVGGNDDVNKVLVPKATLRTSVHTGFTDTAELEADNVRRFMPMVVRIEDVLYPSFTTLILMKHWNLAPDDVEVRLGEEIIFKLDAFEKKVPINERGELRVSYQPREHFDRISYGKFTKKLYDYYQKNQELIREAKEAARISENEQVDEAFLDKLDLSYMPEEEFRLEDRILIVAITESGFVEFGGTPYEESAWPVLTYLSAIDNIFNDYYLLTPDRKLELGSFLFMSIGTLIFLRGKKIRLAVGVPALCVLAYLSMAVSLLIYKNTLMMILWPMVGFSALHVGAFILRLVEEMQSKQELRSMFSSYIAPGVMDQLMRSPENIRLGGQKKPVTILFSDIRGFTSISEKLGEVELVEQLNEYFERMVDCVNKTQGTLHKYIGDAIMASWGDVISRSPAEDARNAVMSALAMRDQLVVLNDKWQEQNRPPFRMGVGLNFGECLVGNIGATQRREFTLIGDAVNLASRLESLTKQFQVDIAIGETVRELLGDDFLCRPVGNLIVKGKTKPVLVYEVVGMKFLLQVDSFEWYDDYETAFQLYVQGKFTEAYPLFDKCLKDRPRDFLTMELTRTSREYSKTPPEDWDGVIRLIDK